MKIEIDMEPIEAAQFLRELLTLNESKGAQELSRILKRLEDTTEAFGLHLQSQRMKNYTAD